MAINPQKFDIKNLDLKDVYAWPIYARAVICLVVCVGVFYFGYFFDFSNLSGQIITRFKQEQDLKGQVKSILKSEEDMKELVTQFPEVVKLLNQWQGQLIQAEDLPDLLNQILKLGQANHLQFTQFAPGEKIQVKDYWMVPLKVVVQGSYDDIAGFISQVANLPQLVAIGDFNMIKEGDVQGKKRVEQESSGNFITAALTLEVYYLANKS